ncbi:MAG: ABC-2 transporter permease [Sphaerochaetaceae bacterium]|jgi:hypothetical protein
MIYRLLYKEFRLAAHPNLYVFMCFGALVMIPAYPYGVVFLFGCLGPYITFLYGRETNDIFYSVLLPVDKRDVVKGKCLLVATSQLAQLILSLPFAFLRTVMLPEGNIVGIEANVAYYGFGLMVYAVFDLVFLTSFFKTAYKVGRAFVLGMVPALLMIIAMETAVHFPSLAWLDGLEASDLFRQLPILAFGAASFALCLLLACKVSAERFECVDL